MARKSLRKASSKKSTSKVKTSNKPRSKSEIYRTIADQTGVNRRQVSEVFDTMKSMIAKDLSTQGPGVFSVPGMMKVLVVRKPATKARKGINPFTGEETMFKAKPARNVVKIRALKALKDLV